MLGVEDHRDVEGLHHLRHRLLAERHPQEVGGVAQVVAGLHQVLAAPAALVVGHDGGHGREQVHGLGHVGLAGGILGEFVPGAHDRGRRPADIHGVGRGRQGVDHLLDHRIQGTAGPLPGREGGQLLRGGQFAVPEQVGDLLEAAPGGQFLDRIAAVQQRVRVGVDLGDGGVVHHDAGEALFDLFFSHAELLRSLSSVVPAGAGSPVGCGQSVPGIWKLKTPVSKRL